MTKKKSWVLLLYEEDQESFRLFVGTFWWDSKLRPCGWQVCKSLVLLQQASVLEQMAFSSSLVYEQHACTAQHPLKLL
jgi:hypothetical protein